MARRNERDLLQGLRQQLRACHGFEGDKIASDRQAAYDYYFQRARGDEVAGASQVVSGDLSAMVEATLAQMMDAFSGDALAQLHASGAEDEDQAALESEVVQDFLMRKNNGFVQFLQSIKDGLLVRNAVMKIWFEEKTRSRRREFENVSSDALAQFSGDALPPGVSAELLKHDPDTGALSVRLNHTQSRLRAESLPPENFLYPKSWDSLDMQEVPFCAERHLTSRSDMLLLGFPRDKVNQLKAHTVETGMDKLARKPGQFTDTRQGIDRSQDIIEWFECYALQDHDGDGISERRRIAIAGVGLTSILSNEPVSLVPYALGAAIIVPHEVTGMSLYDKLRQIQDVSTGLERALLDNVEAVNRSRLAHLDGMVNTDDLDNGRPNASIRVRRSAGNVSNAIMPIIVPDLSAGILQNLQHQRQLRSEMGGASLDMATGQMQLNDRLGSQGLDRAYSVMEQLAGLMTRTMATTLIRSAFLLTHATLRENFFEPVNIKRGGRWLQAIPAQWPERSELTIKVGMSPGERARRAQSLEALSNMQIGLADKGMDEVLVSLDNYYNLIMDWCRAQDIVNPEQYFVDPRSEQSVNARKAKTAQAQQDTQAQQAFLQQAVELEQMRTAFDKYRQDTELQFKYWQETLRAEIEEAKIVGAATADMLKAKTNGQKDPGPAATTKPAIAGADSSAPGGND